MPEFNAPILMQHPEHGSTHVYTQAEYEERSGKGWKEPSVAALLKPPVEMSEPEKRKPGRPRKVQ